MSNQSSSTRDTVREAMRDAKEAVREGGKAVSGATGDIQTDLEALRKEVVRLASQLTEIVGARGGAVLSRARANVEGVVADASAKGQQAVDAVSEVGDNIMDALDESLKKRPYTTLAIAVGIGFLFGAIWRR
jgi:ElaB/YqjD/DUF883 family membrane-anchored ribosome-binding protein